MVGWGPWAHWKIFTALFWNGSAGMKAKWLTSQIFTLEKQMTGSWPNNVCTVFGFCDGWEESMHTQMINGLKTVEHKWSNVPS